MIIDNIIARNIDNTLHEFVIVCHRQLYHAIDIRDRTKINFHIHCQCNCREISALSFNNLYYLYIIIALMIHIIGNNIKCYKHTSNVTQTGKIIFSRQMPT